MLRTISTRGPFRVRTRGLLCCHQNRRMPCASGGTRPTILTTLWNAHTKSSMASSTEAINERNRHFCRNNLFDLKDKVALVTGGGSGIGLMIAQALATNGAKVYITGRTREKLDRVVELYGSDVPGSIIALPGDISHKEGVRALADEFARRESCCCILVNNAGIASQRIMMQSTPPETPAGEGNGNGNGPSQHLRAAEELRRNLFDAEANSYEDWSRTYRTNVTACYFLTTAMLPLLQRSSDRFRGWSATVINISSISGLIKASQNHPAYNASKAAAIHLTRMLATEITAAGLLSGGTNRLKIRVNGIAPGVFPSEMTTNGSDEDQKSRIEVMRYAHKVPAARPGRDEDMAQAVLFCATNQYLVGQTIVVDGGYTITEGE